MCSSTRDDTHTFEPSRIVVRLARPFGRAGSVGSIPGHAQVLGEVFHRLMMNCDTR